MIPSLNKVVLHLNLKNQITQQIQEEVEDGRIIVSYFIIVSTGARTAKRLKYVIKKVKYGDILIRQS